jgi:CheY-like chemotaxis protein
LAPYRVNVDTCLSGAEAIELIKRFKYDIIFMDHMMPEMDGIEATKIIREWEKIQIENSATKITEEEQVFKQMPIIALTANAVSGVREMFIENKFDDFLAKPIDVSKLDDMLNTWIPKEKRQRGSGKRKIEKRSSDFPEIFGVDIQKGISMTGGTEEKFISVLSIFCRDSRDRLGIIMKALEEDTLSVFVIHIHSIKSASASIGADEVSLQAAELEKAGKSGDKDTILEKIGSFSDRLSKLINEAEAAMELIKIRSEQLSSNDNLLNYLLKELEVALKTGKAGNIERILNDISQQPLNNDEKEVFEKISDEILMAEYDNAVISVAKLLKK